jgi:hypothetical protein
MFHIRPTCLKRIVMVSLIVMAGNKHGMSTEIYRITAGNYSACCAIWGSWGYQLPAPRQMFVELTWQANPETARMRILDTFLDELQLQPFGFFGSDSPFADGTVDDNTIRFRDEQVEPDPPWNDPSDEFFGILDYTVSVEEEQLRMNGSFTSNTCFDCFSTFMHLGVQARLVTDPIPGDLNEDGQLEIGDLELLSDYPDYPEDLVRWVKHLRRTWVGDANLDGEFNSSDMVQVFVAGKYETEQDAGWAGGDWDGNGVFDSSDMVTALADGGYEQGPRTDGAAVPEPSAALLLLIGSALFLSGRRNRQLRVKGERISKLSAGTR